MRNGKASPTVKNSDAPSTAPSTYGRGGVEELPSGRFRVRLMVDGEQLRETCDTREEAEALRRALVQERHERDRQQAAVSAPKPEVITLASWGEKWLERREARVRWFANDKSRWKLYVAASTLATMPLAEVRPKHVRSWLADLSAMKRNGELLTTRTVRHVLNLVRKALGDAFDDEEIAANPALGVKIPKRTAAPESTTREFLTVDEIRTVETGEGIPDEARLLYVVAIYTGLREGELWGLRWGDVHEGEARPLVVVRWSHSSAPKNGKVQSVPLLPKARAAFERLRELATIEGVKPGDDALVFPSPRGHQRPVSDDGGWSSRKVHGRPRVGHREVMGLNRAVTFHGLRHTCGSHLIIGTFGVTLTLAEVRVFLRHEDVSTTDQYAHLAPGHLHERIAAMPSATRQSPAAARESTPADDPPSTSSAAPQRALVTVPETVATDCHEAPSETCHAEAFSRRAILDSNQWPWASETRAKHYKTSGFGGVVAERWHVRPSVASLHNVALDLLRAVDEGHPVAPPARALAVEVLRSTAPDSPPWLLAVTVLEGGPLRARNAVELAGVVLDAYGVEAVDEAAG